jgi:6-phosphofructokinase 1
VIGGNGSLAGVSHRMAAWMPAAELAPDVATRSPVDPYCWLVDLGAVLAETDRLLQGHSPLARWRAGAFAEGAFAEIEDALLL